MSSHQSLSLGSSPDYQLNGNVIKYQLTKPPKILRSKLRTRSGLKTTFWFLNSIEINSPSWALCKGITMDVFCNEPLDMTFVAWNVLVTNFVEGPSDPCHRLFAVVSKDFFRFIHLFLESWAVQLRPLRRHGVESFHQLCVSAQVSDYLLFYLACGWTKSLWFGRNMAGIPRKKVFLKHHMRIFAVRRHILLKIINLFKLLKLKL